MSTTAPPILIVEDDASIAAGLALNLKLEGFAPRIVGDGETALQHSDRDRPVMVLLDITLPRKNGLEVLEEARRAGHQVPIIVLSARQDEYDKVAALRLGADDYVTKPFAVAELLARVAAVLRRSAGAATRSSAEPAAVRTRRLECGAIAVDLDRRLVTRAGEEVRVTHLEFELLRFLLENAGKVFTREELLRKVWGTSHAGSARTIDNFVAQLRAKLEADPEAPRHLVTVRGSGYRFDR